MRIFSIIGLCLLGFSCFASSPKGCPQTRACKEDKNCKIYGFKHNCHAQCEQRTLQFPDKTSIQCPLQCLCPKA